MKRNTLAKRRGVSPVIAALLLIAISVAAAVITYSWVMTMIDQQGSQAQTAIRFEEVQFDYAHRDADPEADPAILVGDFYQVKLVVRNAGGVTAQMQTMYLYQGDTRLLKVDGIEFAITAGDTAELGFTTEADNAWTDDGLAEPDNTDTVDPFEVVLSKAYTVRIITDNGFTIEGTYYTPAGW